MNCTLLFTQCKNSNTKHTKTKQPPPPPPPPPTKQTSRNTQEKIARKRRTEKQTRRICFSMTSIKQSKEQEKEIETESGEGETGFVNTASSGEE